MPEAIEDFFQSRPPTADKPLYGRTILAVEDSRYVSGVLRLLCQRSGARLRRADTLRAAARHLRTYRPSIVIADLGLPDGSGLDLIRDLSSAEPRLEGLVALSGDDTLADAAIQAGADLFMAKPLTSVGKFQADILSLLPLDARPAGPRPALMEVVSADSAGLRDDFQHAAGLLQTASDAGSFDYCVTFLMGLAKASDDTSLSDAVVELQTAHRTGTDWRTPMAAVSKLVAVRLAKVKNAV